MLSFLHAADLHLGMRVTRFPPEVAKKVREARFQALENIRTAARQRAVDCVLVAGDLFDHDCLERDIAHRAFDLLESFPVPVWLISGNHDPLLAGSVWDRPPWNQADSRRVRLLREAKPVRLADGALLFPCPVFRKTSMHDPTAWIGNVPVDSAVFRIGLAHGSLKVRAELPPDDHLIEVRAAEQFQLDYLALGHWHRRQEFAGPGGVRTAYSGTHEPMRFPDSASGWTPCSASRREFFDADRGEVIHVRIEQPGAVPVLEPVPVNYLIWEEEERALTPDSDLGELINSYGTRPELGRRLLRLKLQGVVDAPLMLRLPQLGEVLDRYLWHDLDQAGLHLRPSEEQVRAVAGDGVLRRVLEQLEQEAGNGNPEGRLVAERAILILYRLAQEVQA
jgi:DNA repair exonuclease SbcCD nuclease subunit